MPVQRDGHGRFLTAVADHRGLVDEEGPVFTEEFKSHLQGFWPWRITQTPLGTWVRLGARAGAGRWGKVGYSPWPPPPYLLYVRHTTSTIEL